MSMAQFFFMLIISVFTEAVHGVNMAQRMTMTINPIRRVITMLEHIGKKVDEELKKDEDLYNKFECYCKTSSSELKTSISAATAKLPQLESGGKENEALQQQQGIELQKSREDVGIAKKAVAQATQIRQKERATFAKESAEMKTNIAAIGKAIKSLKAGTAEFLQQGEADNVGRLSVELDMTTPDRDVLSSFLSDAQQEGGSEIQSGEILGILSRMQESMKKALVEAAQQDEQSEASFRDMVAAKEKEIAAARRASEDKIAQAGSSSVALARLDEDMEDTSKSLAEDKALLADLVIKCKARKIEWQGIKKSRMEEVQAIYGTIKILNDDNSLDLFKEALPSPSLLQMKVSAKEMRESARQLIRRGSLRRGNHDSRMNFIALALRGRKFSFDKLNKMIDDLLLLLKDEQQKDEKKKQYCIRQIEKAEDKGKVLKQIISDKKKAVEDLEGAIEMMRDEVKTLQNTIKETDKEVVETTAQRKQEHEAYKENVMVNKAAKDVLAVATQRLKKFYARARQHAAAFAVVVPGDFSDSDDADNAESDSDGGNTAFLQVSLHAKARVKRSLDEASPPAEAASSRPSGSEAAGGVLQMMSTLARELDKELAEMKVEEEDSQAEYEKLIADSGRKRAADLKAVADKDSAKADAEANLDKLKKHKKSKLAEAMAGDKFLMNLHEQCDWLLSNFDVRAEARSDEMDSLQKSQDVLSGADYSLVQMSHKHSRKSLQ